MGITDIAATFHRKHSQSYFRRAITIRRSCLVGDKFTKPHRAVAARSADHLADLGLRDVGQSLEGAGNGGRVQLGKGRLVVLTIGMIKDQP